MKNRTESKKEDVKKDDPEQSRRFVEKARELESDESGNSFEEAFTYVTPEKDSEKKARE